MGYFRVSSASSFGVLVLCRAIGMDWLNVAAILRARLAPEDAGASDLDGLSPQYQQLSVSSAQRILRFWQSRQEQELSAGPGQAA